MATAISPQPPYSWRDGGSRLRRLVQVQRLTPATMVDSDGNSPAVAGSDGNSSAVVGSSGSSSAVAGPSGSSLSVVDSIGNSSAVIDSREGSPVQWLIQVAESPQIRFSSRRSGYQLDQMSQLNPSYPAKPIPV